MQNFSWRGKLVAVPPEQAEIQRNGGMDRSDALAAQETRFSRRLEREPRAEHKSL
jgi:hypothetical protein